jgi:hypothetical protein
MGLLRVVRENKIPEEVPGTGPPALLLVFYFPTNPLVEILNDKVNETSQRRESHSSETTPRLTSCYILKNKGVNP